MRDKIKKVQSRLNSLNKKIEENRNEIKNTYNTFSRIIDSQITLENYIENRANIQLYENLRKQIGQLVIDLNLEKERLKEHKTDEEIILEREKKSRIFKDKYFSYNAQLELPSLEEERYYKLYDISSFPFQGVQLHLAVLSYHFAFNNLLIKSLIFIDCLLFLIVSSKKI